MSIENIIKVLVIKYALIRRVTASHSNTLMYMYQATDFGSDSLHILEGEYVSKFCNSGFTAPVARAKSKNHTAYFHDAMKKQFSV